MKHTTLLFLLKDNHILLAMKKRGFGAGRWNGVGGKIEAGETIVQAAVRECFEEIGVRASFAFDRDQQILPDGTQLSIVEEFN